jgi:hypothetical protein
MMIWLWECTHFTETEPGRVVCRVQAVAAFALQNGMHGSAVAIHL